MFKEIYDGTVRLRDGALEIVAKDGRVLWNWCPPDARAVAILAVPQGEGVIVLAEPIESPPKGAPTLFRCCMDGKIAWTAEVPPGGDGTYVSVAASEGHLRANTWDGRRVIIDVDTGRIREVLFVK